MLLEQKVKIRWNARYKKRYVDLGYLYTKMGDFFDVDIKHIQPYSGKEVVVQCDYCGDNFTVPLCDYQLSQKRSIVKKDACSKCMNDKIVECNLSKYGVSNPSKLDWVREKVIQTNYDRFGCANPMEREDIKEKLKATCMKLYGVHSALQCPSIKEKALRTLQERGIVPTSSHQLAIFNMLKDAGYDVYLNYPFHFYTMDIALFIGDVMIDVEYDGWYWHKNRQSFDLERDEYTRTRGWKTLRIRSYNDLPNIELIEERIRVLANTNFDYSGIVMDDWIYKECSSNNNN